MVPHVWGSTYPDDTQQEERKQFVCMPILIVHDLEQNEFAATERIEEAQGNCDHSAEETRTMLPNQRGVSGLKITDLRSRHDLRGEEVGNLASAA